MDTATRTAKAERIVEAIKAAGYSARVWIGRDGDPPPVRVYVDRALSRGKQAMGYIAVEADGEINPNGMDRQKALIRDIAKAA